MSDRVQADKQGPYRPPSALSTIDGVIHFKTCTKDHLHEIKNLPVLEGDVFVDTYPKAGTTWVSEIIWQIFFDGVVNKTSLHERVPFLEMLKFQYEFRNEKLNLEEFYLNSPFPRLFKIHLPYHQAPMGHGVNKPKHIYVARNPKDTAVSYYWHYKAFHGLYDFDRSWDEFFEMFIKDEVHYGSWFDHVLGWWAHRDDPNILFLKYEDMKKNLAGAIQQIANFLKREISPEIIERIAKQTTFSAMSDGKGRFVDGNERVTKIRNPDIKFIRKGEVGDWRNYFSEEQNKRYDALYEEQIVGSGLELEFD